MALPWNEAFGAVVAEFLGRRPDGSYNLPERWDRRDSVPVDLLLELERHGVAQKFLNASYVELLEHILVSSLRTEVLRLTIYAREHGRFDLTEVDV